MGVNHSCGSSNASTSSSLDSGYGSGSSSHAGEYTFFYDTPYYPDHPQPSQYFIQESSLLAQAPASEYPHKCLWPECLRVFRRPRDLQRHTRDYHPTPLAEMIDCPRKGCRRTGIHGFDRQDHLTEHLRDLHHWNIPKEEPKSNENDEKHARIPPEQKLDCPGKGCKRTGIHGFDRRDYMMEHLRSFHHWNTPREELKSNRSDDSGGEVDQQDSQIRGLEDATTSKEQSNSGRVERALSIIMSDMKHHIQAPNNQGIRSPSSSAPLQVERTRERTCQETELLSTTPTYIEPELPVPSTLLSTNQIPSFSDREQDRTRHTFAREQEPQQQVVRHHKRFASQHKVTQSIPSPKKSLQLETREIEEPIPKSSAEVHHTAPETVDLGVHDARKNVCDVRDFSFQPLGTSLEYHEKIKRPTWNRAVRMWEGSNHILTVAVFKNPICILGYNGAGDVVGKYSWPKLLRLQIEDADQNHWLGHVQIALLKNLKAYTVANQRNDLMHTWSILIYRNLDANIEDQVL